ncbi:MAG: endonuclease/exonuclease/phosphatase family protein [Actinomycetota bacterium]|nr:endonuclease/exonuclease/phosphatase family protein [Actinomycetota bacterium]
MQSWRFATWNLDVHQRNPRLASPWDLIASTSAEVFAIQELKGSDIEVLRDKHPGESLFSLDYRPDSNRTWSSCALLLPKDAEVLDVGVVPGLPRVQRSLWARVELPGIGQMTVVSWHAEHGAGAEGRVRKPVAFRAMSAWLVEAPRPLALGADVNSWSDRVDLVKPEPDDSNYEEHAFVGLDPAHGLVDAYRAVLERRGEFDALRESAPEGPLAVSHVLPSGSTRRDRVYVSPGLTPIDGAYVFDEAKQAGSDHALHWVELDPPT